MNVAGVAYLGLDAERINSLEAEGEQEGLAVPQRRVEPEQHRVPAAGREDEWLARDERNRIDAAHPRSVDLDALGAAALDAPQSDRDVRLQTEISGSGSSRDRRKSHHRVGRFDPRRFLPTSASGEQRECGKG